MKPLLLFALFCCLSISSMYAVQEQGTIVHSKTVKVKTDALKDSKVASITTSEATKLSAKNTRSKDKNHLRGAFGHAIKRIRHREMIDKRKRIASNN